MVLGDIQPKAGGYAELLIGEWGDVAGGGVQPGAGAWPAAGLVNGGSKGVKVVDVLLLGLFTKELGEFFLGVGFDGGLGSDV